MSDGTTHTDYWRFAADAGVTATQVQTESYRDLAHSTGALAASVGELTDSYDRGADEARELHAETLRQAITALVLDLEREPLSELLKELTETYEFSWSTLARCIKVTPTAVRKWRRGDEASAENKQHVAYLLGFARKLHKADARIADVGYWLEAPMSNETVLTRADVYRVGAGVSLLRMARSGVRLGPDNLGPEQVLDTHVPGWRYSHASDDRFVVEWHADGMPSIVFREAGE